MRREHFSMFLLFKELNKICTLHFLYYIVI
jgi:hypothetical protein